MELLKAFVHVFAMMSPWLVFGFFMGAFLRHYGTVVIIRWHPGKHLRVFGKT